MDSNNVNSLNQAIEVHTRERDAKVSYIKTDKFHVKIQDDKGNVYEIRYFF